MIDQEDILDALRPFAMAGLEGMLQPDRQIELFYNDELVATVDADDFKRAWVIYALCDPLCASVVRIGVSSPDEAFPGKLEGVAKWRSELRKRWDGRLTFYTIAVLLALFLDWARH